MNIILRSGLCPDRPGSVPRCQIMVRQPNQVPPRATKVWADPGGASGSQWSDFMRYLDCDGIRKVSHSRLPWKRVDLWNP